MATSLGLGNI